MPSDVVRDVPHLDRLPVRTARLWVGMLLAPVSWLVMELFGYYLAARSCEPAHGIPMSGTAYPQTVQALLGLVFVVASVIGLLTALGNWRALRQSGGAEPPEYGRARFMAFGGVLVSALFLLGIVLFGLPALIVNACSQAR